MLKSRHTEDNALEAGIDEAGRGCLWGPLVSAAVIWPENLPESDRTLAAQIKDSKLLTPKKRVALETFIKRVAIWSTGSVTAQEIDDLGMTRSNRLAFQRALNGLNTKPSRIIIDGILELHSGLQEIVEPKADGTYIAVAAASILAKEARDTLVRELCATDPTLESRYSILSSKGYGTAAHRAAVKEHGMLPGHRRLFLRKLLGHEHTPGGIDFLD
jgi:ribonuclease HII